MRISWLLLLIPLLSMSIQARPANPGEAQFTRLDVAGSSGEIRGGLESCSPAGTSGVVVYVVGRSFSALLGADGRFTLSYVPAGIHSLAFVRDNNVIMTTEGIEVRNRQVTDLGVIDYCPDADGDGYDASLDCNDNNPAINPGATETCNGVDDDCDGVTDNVAGGCSTCTDADNDGYFAQASCSGPVDCDDANANVSPAAPEICDGRDNNCDGSTDEGFDNDADGYTLCGGDCDDDDPATSPGAGETCGDGIDNDCDGQADEGCTTGALCTDEERILLENCLGGCIGSSDPIECSTICLDQVSGDCATSVQILGLCALGSSCSDEDNTDLFSICVYQQCTSYWVAAFGDFVPECPAGYIDCNGQCVDLTSNDVHCGQCGNSCPAGQMCSNGTCGPFECEPGLTNCFGECVDLQADPENCGQCSLFCESGICENGLCTPLTDLDGDGWPVPDDCDDLNPSVNPEAPEVCDGLDNNCDGQADETCQCEVGAARPCYTGPEGTEGVGICSAGTQFCSISGTWSVCQDQVLPSQEVCDGLDNNCDGQTDEGDLCR